MSITSLQSLLLLNSYYMNSVRKIHANNSSSTQEEAKSNDSDKSNTSSPEVYMICLYF
jgi:hypothetical protein